MCSSKCLTSFPHSGHGVISLWTFIWFLNLNSWSIYVIILMSFYPIPNRLTHLTASCPWQQWIKIWRILSCRWRIYSWELPAIIFDKISRFFVVTNVLQCFPFSKGGHVIKFSLSPRINGRNTMIRREARKCDCFKIVDKIGGWQVIFHPISNPHFSESRVRTLQGLLRPNTQTLSSQPIAT